MQTNKTLTSTKTVWINARFLERPVTGVERVAREIINTLANEYIDEVGCWTDGYHRYQIKLIAPRSTVTDSPWPNLPLHRQGLLTGHAWEQLELPRITFGDCLISLCNTGPLVKRKHLIFLHDAQPFAIPENFSMPFRLWYRFMFNVTARMAQRVLVNSRFTLLELGKYIGLNPLKTDLCYLGHEHARRHGVSADTLSRFELPEKPFVLAVSSSNPNKNFRAVVTALELLGDDAPPCVIVGQQSQAHFAQSRIDDTKVQHLGYVTDEELFALYRRALCLAFPSFYEGFGLPPLEAMALGCPVIVSFTSSLEEIGGEAAAFCQPEDPATLAHHIQQIAQNADLRETYSKKSRIHARQFSWHKCGGVVLKAVSQCHQPGMAMDKLKNSANKASEDLTC